MKKVIVIVGPTAIGKTNLSVNLAKSLNAEIINGDSVSLYKKLNIGSAKITKDEMDGVIHHLVDEIDPRVQFSAADFQRISRDLIEKIDIPFIVGGTGLYIKSSLYDYNFNSPRRDNSFADKYNDLSNEELFNLLLQYDKNTTVHMNNRKRVLRSLESAFSNNLISENSNKDVALYDAHIIYLDLSREQLYERINQRVIKMFDDGLEKEVLDLYNDGITVDAIGYKEFIPYFKGEISKEELIDTIQKNTRHLAKKQITWFKNQMKTNFYNVLDKDLYDNVYNDIIKFMEK